MNLFSVKLDILWQLWGKTLQLNVNVATHTHTHTHKIKQTTTTTKNSSPNINGLVTEFNLSLHYCIMKR